MHEKSLNFSRNFSLKTFKMHTKEFMEIEL